MLKVDPVISALVEAVLDCLAVFDWEDPSGETGLTKEQRIEMAKFLCVKALRKAQVKP